MTKQTEAERLTALFKQRSIERSKEYRFSYNKVWEKLAPYKLDDKYLLSEDQLRELLQFARHGAMWDERDRCVRVCEWNAENAVTQGAKNIYWSLADELEEAYEP